MSQLAVSFCESNKAGSVCSTYKLCVDCATGARKEVKLTFVAVPMYRGSKTAVSAVVNGCYGCNGCYAG
jgi:hypothetical protein